MQDEQKVLDTFNDYSKKFELLKPGELTPFYHYPSILISDDKAAALKNKLEAWFVLTKVMGDLKKENYHHSVMRDLKVKFLSEKLATITGAAKRVREDKSVIIDFGLTYTLRKMGNEWKIIAGIIHDVLPL